MTAKALYGLAMLPFVVWLLVGRLVTGVGPRLLESRMLTPLVEFTLTGGLWALRILPPTLVLMCLLAAPLLAWVAPRIIGSSFRVGAQPRDVIPWVVILLLSWGSSLVSWRSLPTPYSGWVLDAIPFLWWSGAMAQALVIAIAYLAQAELNASGRSNIPAKGLLFAGVILQLAFLWPGFLALIANKRHRV